MSTVAVLTKGPQDPRHYALKALDSMRLPEDSEPDVAVRGRVAIGFTASLASTGKMLAMAQPEGGSGTALIATPKLLREAGLDTTGKVVGETIPENISDALAESAIHQRCGWSLIGAVEDRLLGGRDVVGQRPLFWGRSSDLVAVASCRKALWSLGVSSVDCIQEGTIAELGEDQHRERRIGELTRPEPLPFGMDRAATELQELVYTSVKAIIQDSKRVGVLFSGGLDSSIVAKVADDLGIETRLYTAAFEDSTDAASAERAAHLLGLRLEVEAVPRDEAEGILRRVVWEIESCDPTQVCVGMPIEAAAKKAARAGDRVLLSGCGADELFGGYSRYSKAYHTSGEEGAADMMFRDVLGLGRRDLLRDGAIAEANRVQLSAPFLDLELVRFGLGVPVALKLQEVEGGPSRKGVLRRVAQMMGVPKEIVELPKRAAQYSSKSMAVAKRLARREGLSLRGYLESVFKEVFNDYSANSLPS